jgi:sugar lactone lactonase YvrE
MGPTLRGVAIGPGDRLHAVGDGTVTVFGGDGQVARAWRTGAPAWAVAVSGDGRVFVGEDGQIEIFDPNGRLEATWRHAKRLGRVTAIGFVDGDVLAGDAAGRAIRRFDADGAFRNDIGADNRMQGVLIPNGVVQFGVDDSGVIHAANPGKHRVERYLPDGQLLGHFGRFDGNDPAGFGGCCNPTNVAVAGGRIYVTEKADPRAKLYGLDGTFLGVIAGSEFDLNCKNMSIAVDSRGRVYVADTVRLEVLVFEPRAEAAS